MESCLVRRRLWPVTIIPLIVNLPLVLSKQCRSFRTDDGTLFFATEIDNRQPGLYRIRKHFQVARDLSIMLAGETVQLLSDTQIEMSWSYKYDRDTLVGLITSSGMQLVAEYASTDKRFLTLLAKK